MPPLILGQNTDLREYIASSSSTLKLNQNKIVISNSERIRKFDLNLDTEVNAVDLSILLDEMSKKSKDKKYDFNNDGRIDQTDVELIKQSLK